MLSLLEAAELSPRPLTSGRQSLHPAPFSYHLAAKLKQNNKEE